MATIYKRRDTKPIPDGAELVTFRGRRYATWTKAGKVQRAPLNAAGDKIVLESQFYTVQYYDHDGRRVKEPTRCSDKDAAQQIANELEKQAMLRARGIIDPTQERYATEGRRPLADHLANFREYLQGKGRTVAHVRVTCAHVERLLSDCRAERIAQVQGPAVLQALGAIRDAGGSLRTCNAYLRSIKSFTRWLRNEKRIADDPLAGLTQFNESTDRRHVRRELTPDEIQWLLATTECDDGTNYNLPGDVRAMAYRVALGTGFRVNELRDLTPASFDLDADPPTATVAAGHSKRRRQDEQPMRTDLAELLRAWLEGRPRRERLFPLPHNTSKMFQRDLAAARAAWLQAAPEGTQREERERSDFLQYRDASDRVADFHALRHTYISGIVATGASVKTAQELARHSTPVLTIGRYSHARLHDLRGALDALPGISPSGDDPQALQATGTDAAQKTWGHYRGQLDGKTCPNVAIVGQAEGDGPAANRTRQVLNLSELGDMRREESQVVRAGIEPATHGFSVREQTPNSSGKTSNSETVGAPAGAVETKNVRTDDDLQALIEAWPNLPEPLRAGILAMVRGATR